MKRRCYSETDVEHESYRSRGIKVCDRWLHSFENFLADMGERPEGKTLDRIDNKGGYIPENCRWATRSEQQRNKENTKLYEYKGKTGPLIYWVESLGISKSTLLHRLNDLHWGIEKSFSTPVRKANYSR
jgi:hypothetical protein